MILIDQALNLRISTCVRLFFLCTTFKCIEFFHKICDSVHKIWDSDFKSEVQSSNWCGLYLRVLSMLEAGAINRDDLIADRQPRLLRQAPCLHRLDEYTWILQRPAADAATQTRTNVRETMWSTEQEASLSDPKHSWLHRTQGSR